MADQATITSIDALESLRAALVVFLSRAQNCLDETSSEVRRTRTWVQNDQRFHWEGEVRRWRKALDQAQQELLSARISSLRDTTTAQQVAVNKAKRALAESENKLRAVKRWNRDFDVAVDPLLKRTGGLRTFLDHDLPKAIAYLAQAQRTLEAYSETGFSPAPAADGESAPSPQ